MKLRNKKTGKIYNACNICFGESIDDLEKARWKTLKEFCDDWEDCKPTEPLIEDKKIRKAVRAWADANNIPNDVTLDVFEYLGTGVTAIQYLYKTKTLPHERCVQFEYISSDEIYNSQNNREYTIEELCGEEEE